MQSQKPTPTQSRLGDAIRKARQRAGLSQLAVAHAIGFTGQDAGAYICRVEGGHIQPRFDTLARICNALGIEMKSLLY